MICAVIFAQDDPFGEVMRMLRLHSAQAKNKADLSRFAGSDRFMSKWYNREEAGGSK